MEFKLEQFLIEMDLGPARYVITKGGVVVLASETGVLSYAPEEVACKGKLQPGKMFLIDTKEGRIIDDL